MNEENMTAVSAVRLTKTFEGNGEMVAAVHDVSIEIKKGRILLIRGPNGSGKTTLLSMLGCLLPPTSGKLSVLGQDISLINQNRATEFRRKHIGYIFQSFRLIEPLTALENVELIHDLSRADKSESRDRARKLLEEVNMLHRANYFPHALSGGEKQRIAIARAFANQPEILLADEPTGSLDSNMGRHAIELLCETARKRNNTVVIVSHDERIRGFVDRILLMEDGRIVKETFS